MHCHQRKAHVRTWPHPLLSPHLPTWREDLHRPRLRMFGGWGSNPGEEIGRVGQGRTEMRRTEMGKMEMGRPEMGNTEMGRTEMRGTG